MKKASITVNKDYEIDTVEDRVYGAFLEPIRNWVYGGIYNPKHPTADDMGFRQDILEAVKEFGMPAIRLPGGNFVSGWEWRDSIGPLNERKANLDLAWRQYEPNIIGHDEYIEWARRANTEPMYTVNLGTGDITSAIQCVEYSNHPGGTYWSDLRVKNGYKDPHKIKTWYLGNEMDGPWQIRSWQKDPKGYGVLAHETSKAMKWVDPSIETVACVSCSPYLNTYPEWDLPVLEQCYETVDYVSLHHYHGAPIGSMDAYLNASSAFEDYIRTEIAACDYMKTKLRTKKTMMLSFDEYGSMFKKSGKTYTGKAGQVPFEDFTDGMKGRPFQHYDPNAKEVKTESMLSNRHQNQLLNALTSASILMTFIRHADRVKIGGMTGGVRGAIAFDNQHVWKSATYYTYYLMSKYGRGTSILPVVKSPTFDVKGYNIDEFAQSMPYEDVPSVESAVVRDDHTNDINIFILNRDVENDVEMTLDLKSFENYRLIEHIEIQSDNLEKGNTYEQPDQIVPSFNKETSFDDGMLKFKAKNLSWHLIRLGKRVQ